MIAGGTSASAPLWAAFTALVDASPACRGFTVGFENPALYFIAGSAYAANFHDVTRPNPSTGASDNDTWLGANPSDPAALYPVLGGYDMTTGLGSPVANALGKALCAARAPVYTVRIAGPGKQLSVRGHALRLVLHATDSGNAGLIYSATGLPAGLSINAATGVISGTPITKQTATVTVRAADAFANAGSASFAWAVVVPGKPQLTGAHKLGGLGRGRPKLSFTVAAGTFAPALKSVTIRLPGGLGFAGKARSLAKGITVKAGSRRVAFSPRFTGGALTVAFRASVSRASVAIGGPALTISLAEVAKVLERKVKRLAVSLKATDAAHGTTSLRVTFKKPS
jgi:hypothetical protein